MRLSMPCEICKRFQCKCGAPKKPKRSSTQWITPEWVDSITRISPQERHKIIIQEAKIHDNGVSSIYGRLVKDYGFKKIGKYIVR